MRARVRKILSYLLGTVIAAIAIAVTGEWFIEVAKDKGWYDSAGQTWDRAMSAVLSFIFTPVVYIPLVGLTGVVAGLWLDAALKWAEARKEQPPKEVDWEFVRNEISRILTFLHSDMQGKDSVKDGYCAISQESFTSFYALLFYLDEKGLSPASGIPSPRYAQDDEVFFEVATRYLAAIDPFVRAKNGIAVREFGGDVLELVYQWQNEKAQSAPTAEFQADQSPPDIGEEKQP